MNASCPPLAGVWQGNGNNVPALSDTRSIHRFRVQKDRRIL